MTDPNHYDFSLKPTTELYDGFQKAYEYFNWRLFENKLPNCMITLQRKNRAYGFFSGNRFHREDGTRSDEIALNPSHFKERQSIEVLSTLAHEMVHLYQFHFGKPGRGRYHNVEWAKKMKNIGLQPTSTGEIGGKETGDRVSHLIIPNGLFESSASELLQGGFLLSWSESSQKEQPAKRLANDVTKVDETKSGKRIKYTCPTCGLNVWSRHDAKIDCHTHKLLLLPA